MASLLKLRQMPVLQQCVLNHLCKTYFKNARYISNVSTKKSAETGVPSESTCNNDNWVSYGFDYTNKQEDTNVHNASYFFSITLCLVFGGFYWAYAPSGHMRNWAQREAFLELRRREKANLPLIDPNYIPTSQMKLPSDEELCDTEIVI